MSTETFDERLRVSKPAEDFVENMIRNRGLHGRYSIQQVGQQLFHPKIAKEMSLFQDHTGRPNRLRWAPDFIVADHKSDHRVFLVDVKLHSPYFPETAVIELDALETYRRFERFFNVAVILLFCTPPIDAPESPDFTVHGIRSFDAWRGRLYPTQAGDSGSSKPWVRIPMSLATQQLFKLGIYLAPEKTR